MTILELIQRLADRMTAVFDAGKARRDYEWWDNYQSDRYANGEKYDRTGYLYAFCGSGWGDDTYNPIRQINATANSINMFAYSNITDTKVPVNIAGTKSTNKVSTFANATKLVTVRKFIVNEIVSMASQFERCTKLQNLTIEGTIGKNFSAKDSPLTKESILNVVEHLSDTATEVTATFNASAVNTAFETSDGAADGSTSAEWAALKATKPNWTFATV